MEENTVNPWQLIRSNPIYSNPWISVKEDQVVKPNGRKGIYGTVHFKNKALGIVPVDGEGYTWLVGQYRYPLDEYSWEIPMGGGPLDVDILSSAKRELKEETGLTAEKWTPLGRVHTSNSVTDEEGFIFLAEELTEGVTDFEDTEVLSIRKVSLKEALAMVLTNQITDAISMIGIFKVAKQMNVT
ncbi:MAG: NUDIX domain-containing protein [Thermonemataceae bacterium]